MPNPKPDPIWRPLLWSVGGFLFPAVIFSFVPLANGEHPLSHTLDLHPNLKDICLQVLCPLLVGLHFAASMWAIYRWVSDYSWIVLASGLQIMLTLFTWFLAAMCLSGGL